MSPSARSPTGAGVHDVWDPVTTDALPSTDVAHIHLLRHGDVDTGGQRLAYGHADFRLSQEGQQASADLIQLVRSRWPRVDLIISSDLSRCSELAEGLADALADTLGVVPLRLDPALREQAMGQWEGRSWASLTAQDEDRIQAYWADYLHTAPPQGESLAQLAERVDAWWSSVAKDLSGKRVVVVTHAGVVRVLLCRALGVPLDQALRFAPARGSHTHLIHSQAGFVVECLGERPAVAGTDSVEVQPQPQLQAAPRPCRIALSGSAGTGKSTLGRAVAARMKLPYLPEGMRSRLEAGLDLHALGPAEFRTLLWDLWHEQCAAEDAAVAQAGGYIADRSPWDYAAFWLHYQFATNRAETERFFASVRARAMLCQRIILLPWGGLPLLADGVRSTNPWLQRQYQACVEGLLGREVDPRRVLRLPPLADLDARVAWSLRALSRASDPSD